MNKYFKNCKNIEDVKETFRDLAKKLHPDNGGDAEQFKAMMNEYKEAFNRLENKHRKATEKATDQDSTEQFTETPEQFADIISRVVNLDGVEIEIFGHWVWLSGNTYFHKDTIKKAGFFFSSKHKKWYWNGGTTKSRKHSRMSYETIKAIHGYSKVKSSHTQARLATA